MRRTLQIALLLFFAPLAWATSYTLTSSGTVTTATYSPGGTPGSGDTIAIPDGMKLTIANGQSLTISGIACSNWTNTGTGAFEVQNGGTLDYQGNMQWCGSGWSIDPGATITHDSSLSPSSNYTFLAPSACSNCSLTIGTTGACTTPVTWNIAGGSGVAGPIGSNSTATYVNALNIGCVNFTSVGSATVAAVQDSLANSGESFVMVNDTCASAGPCGEVYIGKIVAGATPFEINNNTWYSANGSNSPYRGFLIGAGSGVGTANNGDVRQINNNFVSGGQIYIQAPTGTPNILCHVQVLNNVLYLSGAAASAVGPINFGNLSYACQEQPTEFAQNLVWMNATSYSTGGLVLPSGTSGAMYVLASNTSGACPGSEPTNYHLVNFPPFDSVADTFISEALCTGTTSPIAGKLFNIYSTSTTGTWTEEIRNSIFIPASTGTGYALAILAIPPSSCSTSGSPYCPIPYVHNNTYYAHGTDGSQCGVGGPEVTAVATYFSAVNNNIGYLTSPGNGCKIGSPAYYANLYQGVDYNWWFNITGGTQYGGVAADYASPSPPGPHDTANTDPQFAAPTRNFYTWCASLDGAITGGASLANWTACLADFATHKTGFTPAALITYVQGGFRPTNSATATAGIGGTQVGAVPYSNSTGATWSGVLKGVVQ